MANSKNLKPFTKDNQPPGHKKSRKGIPNRATVLKKWLNCTVNVLNPITGGQTKVTVEDEVILALITRARAGDVPAIREILDSVYGKQGNTNLNLNPDDLKNLTDAELDDLISRFSR